MLDPVVNFGKVTVSTGYNDTDTTVVLTAGGGSEFPAPATEGAFNVVWWNSTDYGDPADDPNVEIVRVTAISTDTLTVLRSQEDTSATTKNTGSKTYKMVLALTKKTIDALDGRYTFKYDPINSTQFFRGDAALGSSESEAVWRISLVFMHNDGTSIDIVFADGDTEFDNIWDNRGSLFYPHMYLLASDMISIQEYIEVSVGEAPLSALVIDSMVISEEITPAVSVPTISDNYSSGLQVYWELEEASGIRYDSTANGNDLTDNNAPGQGTGIQGDCADLVLSNNEYFTINSGDATGLHSFSSYISFSFWIKPTQIPSGIGSYVSYAYTYLSAGIKNGYQLGMENAGDKMFFRFWGASADSYIETSSAFLVSGDIGNWVHVGMSVDVSAVTGILYKNGSAVTFNTSRSSSTSTGTSTNPLFIGTAASANQNSDGLLDEFGIWNTQFTGADFIDIYNSGNGMPYE